MNSANRLPRSFYTGIIEEIDPKLKEFYDIRKGRKYFEESFYDICAGVLSDALYGRSGDQSALNKFFIEKKKQNNRKKKRWLDSLIINCDQIPMTAVNFPFSEIVLFKKKATKAKWDALYDGKTLERVIEEELERAGEWAEDKESRLIDFPAIDSCTDKQIFTAFEADVLIAEYGILKEKYTNLDLSEFMLSYVDEMGGAYFTDNGKRYHSNSKEEDYVGEIPITEDGSEKLLVTVSKEAFGDNAVITMLDDKDQRILFDIIKRASADVSSGDKPILIELGELAKVISRNSKPAKHYYDEAEKRCYKIANFTYNKYVEGVQVGAVNFLSAAFLDERDGKKYMQISLGSTVSDAIVQNKVRRLPSASYDALTNKTARILVLSMQRERIKASVKNREGIIPDCSTSFRYNDFLLMVNFGSANKRKNMQTIKEALAELRDRKVVIENFSLDSITNTVKVWWIPLTDDEWRDLSWFGYDEDEVMENN